MLNVFVTSYKIANLNGFACGEWVDVESFSDKEEFDTYVSEMLSGLGDTNPEICISDIESDYSFIKGESDFYNAINDGLFEFLAMDESDKSVISAYVSLGYTLSESLKTALNNYYGYFADYYDLGEMCAESLGLNERVKCYFDYEKFGRDCSFDFQEMDGHYFYA